MATPVSTIEVIQRPNKELYVNNPPELYDVPYYNSRWTSAHLPIVYKLTNDRFPVNTFDTIYQFLSVANNNGNAEVVLIQEYSYDDFVKNNYVTIEGSTLYNGVHRILSVDDGRITINTSYQGTDAGTFQTYYNNYFIGIRVYAGKPNYHPLQGDDPLTLITENPIKITPDGDNIATADVAGLIRDKISMDYDIDSTDLPNDINAWTSLIVEFFESFDESEDGTSIQTVTTEPETDDIDGCVQDLDLVSNGDFSSGLTDWSNVGSGTSWVSGGGGAQVSLNPVGSSKALVQTFDDLLASINYNLTGTYSVTAASRITIKINRGLDDEQTLLSQSVNVPSSPFSIDLNFIPISTVKNISFEAARSGGGGLGVMTLDDIALSATECFPYIFAHNGTKQFQDAIGGNFGDHVSNANFQLQTAKWLTSFQQPKIFDNYYFTLDTIIPEDAFTTVEGRDIYLRIDEYDKEDNLILRTEDLIDDVSDGVYRLRLDDFPFNPDTNYIKTRLIGYPSNSFEDGNDGTFDATSVGNPGPSDWDITLSGIGSQFNHRTTEGNFNPQEGDGLLDVDLFGTTSIGLNEALYFDTPITVIPNAEYELNGYYGVFVDGGSLGDLRPVLIPDGYSLADLSFQESEYYDQLVVNDGVWFETKTTFNTGANTSLNMRLSFDARASVSSLSSLVFDTFTLKGPIFNLSEEKRINLNTECIDPAFEPICLRWLNTLGEWESWLFTARKDHIVDVAEKSQIRRNILRNWDNEFINGETEDDFIRIEAFNRLRVRSQYLTKQEVEAIKEILYSIRVQRIDQDENKITVLVDSGSKTIREDRQKLYSIEFDIQFTNPIQIQSQ